MSQSIGAFLEGIPTFILSIVVVFVMLELLIVAIVLLGKLVICFTNKSEKIKVVETQVSIIEENEIIVEQEKIQDELELIAVITAVIAASIGTTSDQLRVKSLRKVHRKTL